MSRNSILPKGSLRRAAAIAASVRALHRRPRTICSSFLGFIALLAFTVALGGGCLLYAVNGFLDHNRLYNKESRLSKKIEKTSQILRIGVLDVLHALRAGSLDWHSARLSIDHIRIEYARLWNSINQEFSDRDRQLVQANIQPFEADLTQSFQKITPILDRQDASELGRFIDEDLPRLSEPFIHGLIGLASYKNHKLDQQNATLFSANQWLIYLITAFALFSVFLAVALGLYSYRSITGPIAAIDSTLRALANGDLSARSGLTRNDSISRIGSAMDKLLDDRVKQLAVAHRENDELNNAVINLLKAVFRLSKKDLTIKLPVTDDITGPLADSLNLFTEEMIKVLDRVVRISKEVEIASSAAKIQSDSAIAASDIAQRQVQRSVEELSTSAEAMLSIARLAQTCRQATDDAIGSTELARDTVLESISGIAGIHDTIRQTEKRLKRLGERSQEISAVVGLINNISERTHILALNASMHAAAAGESGRGFAVVAEEVQRLAENSRDATLQIASMVTNIQVETAETAATMNEAISKVAAETQLAKRAGEQMQATNKTTSDLVAMVLTIAQQSREHARSSAELRVQAKDILHSANHVCTTLKTQAELTDRLEQSSRQLIEAVSVVTLPTNDAIENPAGHEHSKPKPALGNRTNRTVVSLVAS